MRRAAVDANQAEIVKALRKAGASVHPLHRGGQGGPDLAVVHRGVNHSIEVKDGSKLPSARGLTDAQFRWHSLWAGTVSIAESVEDALRIIGVIE